MSSYQLQYIKMILFQKCFQITIYLIITLYVYIYLKAWVRLPVVKVANITKFRFRQKTKNIGNLTNAFGHRCFFLKRAFCGLYQAVSGNVEKIVRCLKMGHHQGHHPFQTSWLNHDSILKHLSPLLDSSVAKMRGGDNKKKKHTFPTHHDLASFFSC